MSYNPLSHELFLPIPIKLAQRKDLKKISLMVYGCLLKCLRQTGKANTTIALMSKELKRDVKLIKAAIKELTENGLIIKERVGRSSQYFFQEIPEKGETVSPNKKRETVPPKKEGDCIPQSKPLPYTDNKETSSASFPPKILTALPGTVSQFDRMLVAAIKLSLEDGVEATVKRIKYTTEKNPRRWVPYFKSVVESHAVIDSTQELEVEIPEGCSTGRANAVRCYNANLGKPQQDRCQSAFGSAAVSSICRANCPKFWGDGDPNATFSGLPASLHLGIAPKTTLKTLVKPSESLCI